MLLKKAFLVALALCFLIDPIGSVAASPQATHSKGTTPTTTQASMASAAPATALLDASAATLADFAWLEGRWRGEWGPRVAEQVWVSPKAGAMEGMFRLTEADKTLVIEFFTLVQKPDGIAFYFRHFTPSLAPWEKSDATVLNLTSVGGGKFGFENPVNGMPKVASLTRVDPDTYLSHSEIVPDAGEPQVIEITYKRQPTASASPSAGSGGRQKKP